jgi:TonB family protein
MKRAVAFILFVPVFAWAQPAPVPVSAPEKQSISNVPFGSLCAYPDSALKAGATGSTSLEIEIGANGNITNVKVTHPSGNAALDGAAVACALRWQMPPGPPTKIEGATDWLLPSGEKTTVAIGRFRSTGGAKCATAFYPPAAIKAHAEGTTRIMVHVAADGSVSGVDVVRSSGNDDLDEAGRTCVMQAWRFRPALQDGKPIASTKEYEIRWMLGAPSP